MNFQDTTVILPTFNEEGNVARMISKLLKLYPNVSIIVADDGGRDKTQEIVRKLAKRNKHVKLLDRSKFAVHGLTISACHAATIAKTKLIVVMDVDFQHPPEKVGEVVNALRESAEVAVGYRVSLPDDWGFSRKLMSFTAAMLGKLRLLIGGAMAKDIMSGFFGCERKLLTNAWKLSPEKFEPRGYKVLFDLLKLLPRRTKVANVPYHFGLRTAGESKISKKHVMLYLKSLFK